ncbi:hypothetical protein [Bacillus cereus]|uniref:hypothetical protein n=1 Tax=Bacillaceae TaxID=186817 RepID=UPI0038249688
MENEQLQNDLRSRMYVISGNNKDTSNYSNFIGKIHTRTKNMINNSNINNKEQFPGDISNIINDLRADLENVKNQLSVFNEIAYAQGGSNLDMEQLKEKINDIDRKVAILEERTKRLDSLPTRDEMKNIVFDTLENKNLVTNSEVELQIIKSRNTQIIWTIGTVIAAVGIIVRFV